MRSSRQILPLLFGAILLFSLPPPTRCSVNTSFISHLHQTLPLMFNDEKTGIQDPTLNQSAHRIWQEVIDNGYSVHSGQDKDMRTVFGQIQFHLEQQLLAMREQFPWGEAVWIIHTPDIATPLVTNGMLNDKLVSKDVLLDKDKTRIKSALARANLMRAFLAKGGMLIVAHQENSTRTKEQIAIFEALKKQYPKQIIDFPINVKHFPQQKFPSNRIGATYLMQTQAGEVVEMTNQGVPINQSLRATWGIWLQEQKHAKPELSKRIKENIEFLFSNGLHDVLTHHAHQQGIAPEKYLTLLKRYLKGSDAPTINKK